MIETARAYRCGEREPAAHVADLIRRIRRDSHQAFITLDEEGATLQARTAADILNGGGQAHVLTGMPLAIKDNICTRGLATTCASRLLTAYVPPYDAHVIERLRRCGAVILGKTNLDEFAMGSTTTSSHFGPTLNPWDRRRTAGGSSGGSAAAVCAGLCAAALGSDTGGSIRQPASFCGVTGFKPTYGAVSRYGLVAFASSLDQVGPLARSAADAAVLFEVLRGHDARDATSARHAWPPTDPGLAGRPGLDLRGLRIGMVREWLAAETDAQVAGAVRAAGEVFGRLGAEVADVSLAHLRYAVAVYYIVATAEASSNLARFDGVRYGRRAPGVADLHELYVESRTQGFQDEVKRRIMLGSFVLSRGYYEQYYARATRVRHLIADEFASVLRDCDLLMGPTVPVTAFELHALDDDPLQRYLLDCCTVPANLAGLPALSIPCGRDDKGLPIGLQIVGPAFQDDAVLGAGITFQQHTTFHQERA